jgi:HAD superfamily hydrolase (TIGR01490 family)
MVLSQKNNIKRGEMSDSQGKTRIAAFFDFDKTLITTDSGEAGFRWAWEQRLVSIPYILRLLIAGKFYKRNLLSVEKMTGMALRFYVDRDITQFVDGAPEFYQKYLKPKLSPRVLEKIEMHRERGDRLVLLSASVEYLLTAVKKDLGFDDLLATKLEIGPNGLATGRTVGPSLLGVHKRTAAMELAEKERLDLAGSYAYADHHSDIPLLDAVGNPVAVRPTAPLRKYAVRNGWEIIDKV